MKAVFSCKTYI